MAYSVYEQQKINAARRRAIADQLAEQSGRYTQQQVAPGGLVVPLGIENLGAQLGQAWMARRRGRKADEADAVAEKEHETALTGALENYRKSVPDEDVGAESYNRIMAAPEGELAEPTYGRSESQYNLMSEMMPREKVAEFMIQQQMAGDAPYTLAPGARRMQGSRVIGEAPATPRAPEPLENVMTPDGPRKVPRSQASGMEPAFAPDAVLVQTQGQNGEPIYTRRPDAAGQQAYRAPPKPPLSAKEAATARGKLATTALLRQQLDQIKQAYQAVKAQGRSTGPLQGMLPSEAGERFDVAVDAARQLMMTLTRTPGIGASSDYESRLSQAPMPNRQKWNDAAIEDQIANIDRLVTGIEQEYSTMLEPPEGAQPAQPAPAAQEPLRQPGQGAAPSAPQQQAPPAALQYLQQHPEFAEAFRAKYGYLPGQ